MATKTAATADPMSKPRASADIPTSKARPSADPPVSDEAVKRATGRDWAEWCRLLDAEDATALKHGEIARIVHDKFNGGGWWSQMVTVGYEQIRGMRVLHQKGAGKFEISRSKTVNAPIARVYKAWHSSAARRKWLADPDIEISTARANKDLRFGWVDGKTRASVYFTDKGEKTAVTIQHTKLADAKAAAKMKKYWGAQLDALAEHLGPIRT
jgi:uncharacterized protein YndB with AHSA1/START domain